MSERLLAAFAGPVAISSSAGAPSLVLAGRERGSGEALEVLFSGTTLHELPGAGAPAQDLEVFEQQQPRGWRVTTEAREWLVAARAVQVHRGATSFMRALAPADATPGARLQWWLLLTLLRIPGAAALLKWIRTR